MPLSGKHFFRRQKRKTNGRPINVHMNMHFPADWFIVYVLPLGAADYKKRSMVCVFMEIS